MAQKTDEFVAGLTEDIGDFEAESELDIRALQSLGLTDQGVSTVANAFLELLTSRKTRLKARHIGRAFR